MRFEVGLSSGDDQGRSRRGLDARCVGAERLSAGRVNEELELMPSVYGRCCPAWPDVESAMAFFEPPGPEPEPVVPAPYSPPIWTGPSELVLGAWVSAQRLLAKTDGVAVVLRGLCAYPNGFEVHVSFLGRPPQNPQLHQQFFARFHAGRGPRFGFEFSDGRRAGHSTRLGGLNVAKDENGIPTEPVLMPRGGGGGGGEWKQSFWAWPLPPRGRLVLHFDWPDQGIEDTTVELDGSELHHAGANAIELWPTGREPVAEAPGTSPGGTWQQLVSSGPTPVVAGVGADLPGPPDSAGAERAIRAAFTTVFSAARSDPVRLAAIEGGADLGSTMEQARQARERLRGTTKMDITVEGIRFIAEDKAEVSFVLVFPVEPLPQVPSNGTAVLIDGAWKVARQTYCNQVQSLGVECPPESP